MLNVHTEAIICRRSALVCAPRNFFRTIFQSSSISSLCSFDAVIHFFPAFLSPSCRLCLSWCLLLLLFVALNTFANIFTRSSTSACFNWIVCHLFYVYAISLQISLPWLCGSTQTPSCLSVLLPICLDDVEGYLERCFFAGAKCKSSQPLLCIWCLSLICELGNIFLNISKKAKKTPS